MWQLTTQHLRILLAFYPGCHKLSFLWLLGVPILYYFGPSILLKSIFSNLASPLGELNPYPFFAAVSSVLYLIYILSVSLSLLRMNRKEVDTFPQYVSITCSSIVYAFVIGLPIILEIYIFLGFTIGLPFLSLVQSLVGLLLFSGALLLIINVLSLIAYQVKILIPLLLLTAWGYLSFLPLGYSLKLLPEKWQIFQILCPLASAIVITLGGSATSIPPVLWLTGLLQALIGFGLFYWLWKIGQRKYQLQFNELTSH